MIHVAVLEKEGVAEGILKDLQTQKSTWLDITNPTDAELKKLEEISGLPGTDVKEWLSGKKRPVTTDLKEYSLIIFRVPAQMEKHIIAEPCVILVSKHKNDFITVHAYQTPVIDNMRQYSKTHLAQLFKEGPTALLYAFMDESVDGFHEMLDHANEIISRTDAVMFSIKDSEKVMREVFHVKETLIYFHKALVANREVVASIEKEYVSFLDRKYLPYFRSLEIALNQLVELNSTYRDILTNATEVHLSAISNNLNITMKKVTSWGAIILIPSVITGFYGMNFKYFPELDWKYGVPFTLFLMVLSIGVLYWYFKRKDWI